MCRAVLEKLRKPNDAYELLVSADDNSRSAAGSDTNAVPFLGDTFGTPKEDPSDPFGHTMDENEVDADDPAPLMVSDDEDNNDAEDLEMANMVAELERSWEPPREGAPHQEVLDDEVVADDPQPLMEVYDDDGSHIQLERKVDRYIIGDGYGVKPAVRIRYQDKYSSSRAGLPLTHEESKDHAYGEALGGGDNPWAPFKSKKDWEIARWAKLRGPGSTAFSELLTINGVRFKYSSEYIIMFIHVYLTGP